MKRDRENNGHDVSKKPRIEVMGSSQTLVGLGLNINHRHAQQLESLKALVPSETSKLQLADDKSKVLHSPGSCMALYMEWVKKKDAYFLWVKAAKEGMMIKFDFHGGFEEEPTVLDVRNSLLAFSGGFDADHWREVKQTLIKLFGKTEGTKLDSNHDYLIAFTRTGDCIHLRVFKIHEFPTSQSKTQGMKLQHVSPIFILRPLEMHCRDVGDASGGYSLSYTFFEETQFMFADNGNPFNLDEQTVYAGSCSSQLAASHAVQNSTSLVVMLPLPASHSWLGFNTSCKEFFKRYHPTRKMTVPGIGGKHDILTCPMRLFMRSLIMEVGEQFARGCCFSDFTEDNIFLKRGKVAIFGVKLVNYSVQQARRNFTAIHSIMTNRVRQVPFDLLSSAYKYLVVVVANPRTGIVSTDPIVNYEILVNSFVWMDPLDQNHMVTDLYVEFMTFLDPDTQMAVSRGFPDLKNWETHVDENTLLHDVRVRDLKKKCRHDEVEYKAWKEERASILNAIWNLKEDEADVLFNGRLYFGTVRNSYTHLPEHGLKAPIPVKFPPEVVSMIVSTSVGDMCARVQLKVPGSFPEDDPRRSQKRFSIYFHSVDDIEFDSADEISLSTSTA